MKAILLKLMQALLFRISEVGHSQGCIIVRDILIRRFGFDPKGIITLDAMDASSLEPTSANVWWAFTTMLQSLGSRDVLFFYFDTHGKQIEVIYKIITYGEIC